MRPRSRGGRPTIVKALWRLAFAILAFMAIGVNDDTLGIVIKTLVWDPLSIQVHDVHLRLSSFILVYVFPPTPMSALSLVRFFDV
ncbi:hypothetical protein V6N13_076600 [Hibiscus sabdariffa]